MDAGQQPQILVLGRVIVDLYARELQVSLEEVGSFAKYLGGSAGNTAVGLARLGAPVGLLSRVGNDAFGQFLRAKLEAEGVDVRGVGRDPDRATGLAFAALFPPGDSRVLFYGEPSAHTRLSIADIDRHRLQAARVLVVAGSALATSPVREAALWALEQHAGGNRLNVLDVDWRPVFWPDEEVARLYYRKALAMTDVVLANVAELALVGEADEPEAAAARVRALGVSEVVAKRGEEGCWYFGPQGMFRQRAFAVPVVNTLGAGDGFGAAYVFGLWQGWPVAARLRFAAAAGALVVSRHSCSEAMPTQAEVQALLERGEDGSHLPGEAGAGA